MINLILRSLSSASGAAEQLQPAISELQRAGGHREYIAISVLLGVAALLALLHPLGARYRSALVAIPVLIALPFALGILMTGMPLDPIAPIDENARVAIVNEPWDLLTAAPATLPPNLASL